MNSLTAHIQDARALLKEATTARGEMQKQILAEAKEIIEFVERGES